MTKSLGHARTVADFLFLRSPAQKIEINLIIAVNDGKLRHSDAPVIANNAIVVRAAIVRQWEVQTKASATRRERRQRGNG